MADWTTYDWAPHLHDAQIDGRRMRYADIGAGPPILLVHGTGGSWTSWLLNLRELAGEHRVIAPDVPGFGASEGPGPSEDTAPYADGLVALLDHLDIDRVIAVGHSLGGLITFRLALRHPRRVEGIVCVDGGGVPLTRVRLAAVTGTLRFASAALGRTEITRALIHRPRLRRGALRAMLHQPATVTGPMALEMLSTFAAPGLVDAVSAGAGDDAAEHLPEISSPVLLAWGRHDRVLPLRIAEDMHDRLPESDLQVFEASGHCPMLEQSDSFNRAVSEWTRQIQPARRSAG